MRRTFLIISFLLGLCYASRGQEIALDHTIERLVSLQPRQLAESYEVKIFPAEYEWVKHSSSVSRPENPDNAWALQHWNTLLDLKAAPKFQASFLRKHLPLHQDSRQLFRLDKKLIPGNSYNPKVVY